MKPIILTDEQKRKLAEKLIDSPITYYATLEESHAFSLEDWVNIGEPHVVIPVAQDGEYIGCFDTGWGNDLLWDGKEWHVAKRGIFLPDVIFLSNYHGYPEGAMFKRVIQQ